MSENFLDDLRDYYLAVAKVLRGEAEAASVFPNATDVGMSRERVYREFLKQHAPSKCNVFLGGVLFDEDGAVSKQLDIIVTTDTAPRFDLHNKDGSGKSFSPVEGCLGVVSVKSMLNKAELEDALLGIASIPPARSLDGRRNPLLLIADYDDWPLKVIYATDGIAGQTLAGHIRDFYIAHPEIPPVRRPNIIHVLAKHFFIRGNEDLVIRNRETGENWTVPPTEYYGMSNKADLQGIVYTLSALQERASASTHIRFSYSSMMRDVVARENVTT